MFQTPANKGAGGDANGDESNQPFARLGNSFKAFGSQLKAQTEKLQAETSARFQTPSSNVAETPNTASAMQGDPNDVPKEELVSLCVKMSKKVKSLQQTKKDLTLALQNHSSATTEFINFYTAEVVLDVDITNHGSTLAPPPSGYGPKIPNVNVLKNAWRETDERRGLMMQEMQREMQNIIVRHQGEVEKLKEQQREQLELASVFEAPNVTANIATSPPPPVEDAKSKAVILELQEELKALKSKVEQGEKEREVLKEELARSKSSTLKESETLKSTSDALSSLRAEHASTLQSLSSLKSKHDGVAKENEEIKSAHAGLIEKCKVLERESDEKVNVVKTTVSGLESKNSKLEEECEGLKRKMDEVVNRNEVLKEERGRIEGMVKELKSKQSEDVRVMVSKHEAAMSSLQSSNQTTISSLEQSLSTLQSSKSVEAEKFKNKERALRNEIDNLTMELNSSKKQTENMTKAMESGGGEMEGLKVNLENLKKQMEMERVKHKKQTEETEARMNSLAESHASSTSTLTQKHASSLKAMESEISSLKSESDKVETVVERMKEELEEKEKELERVRETEKVKLKEAQGKIGDVKGVLEGQITELQNQVTEVTGTNANLRKEKDNLERIVSSVEERVKRAEEEVGELKKVKEEDKMKYEGELEKLKGLNAQVSSDLTTKVEEVLRLEEKLAKNLNDEESVIKVLEGKVKEMEGSGEKWRREVERLEEEIKRKESERAKASADADASKKSLIDFKTSNSTSIVSIKSELSSANSINAQLKKTNVAVKAELEEERVNNKKLTEELKAVKKQIGKLENGHKETLGKFEKDQATVAEGLREEIAKSAGIVESLKADLATSSAGRSALDKQLSEAGLELSRLQHEVENKEKEMNELRNVVEELEASSSTAVNKAEELGKQVADAEELRKQVAKLTNANNALTTEKVRQDGLLQRMKADADTAEVKYGQRTALVGVLESDLADLKAQLEKAKEGVKAVETVKAQSEEKLKEVEAELESYKEKHESQAAEFDSKKIEMKAAFDKDVKVAEKKLKDEIEKMRKDMQRKSAAAQELYKSHTEKITQLTKEKEELQEEISSGSASDRRLFEIAQKQSSREATVNAEIEIREAAVLRMMKTLVGKDGEYADMEMKYNSVREQLEEYSRMARRDDLNVDYLKGVLVQYLSLPAGSSERKSLLSVLATLLQFGPADYAAIEQGYKSVSWFGFVTPKEIGVKKAAATGAGPLGVAGRARRNGAGMGTAATGTAATTAAKAAAMTSAAKGSPPPAPASSAKPSTPTTGSLMQSSGDNGEDRVGEVKVSSPGAADKKKETRKKRTSMQF